ncbi:MAG TPA: hypothetical protein ENI23_11540 [bacterium]|nr:hypothetical protein [bacterium]
MALDTSSIDPLFQEAGRASEKAIGLTAAGANLPQLLREAVTDRLEASPLFPQREAAAQQVLTSGSRAREDIGGILRRGQAGEPGGAILSPTQQQGIISARGAADVVPLTSLNDLLQARIGGVGTAVQSGLSAFQSLLSATQQQAQSKATQAQDAFTNLLNLAANERAETELGLKTSQGSFLEKLLDRIAESGGGAIAGGGQIGESPQFTPQEQGEASREVDDQGVVWEFNNGQWVPIGQVEQPQPESPGFLQNIFGGLF